MGKAKIRMYIPTSAEAALKNMHTMYVYQFRHTAPQGFQRSDL